MSDLETYRETLKGQLLIAMPQLFDPNFYLTVTCLCEHNAEGALGLVVNRVIPGFHAGGIFKEIQVEATPRAARLPLYLGGPVNPGHLFILHGPPLQWENSFPVRPSLAMSNSKDLIRAIAREEGPADFLIILGCAGWAPGQLEEEILENTWLTLPSTDSLLFRTPPGERWEEAARAIGIDPSLLSGEAGHA
jgi:putative transcriptional regulator